MANIPAPTLVRGRLREQRAELMTLLTLVERLVSRVLVRPGDEPAIDATLELARQAREHLLLESFYDREPTAPELPEVGDTEPAPGLGVCLDCNGVGEVLMPATGPGVRQVCAACFGMGVRT